MESDDKQREKGKRSWTRAKKSVLETERKQNKAKRFERTDNFEVDAGNEQPFVEEATTICNGSFFGGFSPVENSDVLNKDISSISCKD